MGIFGKIRDFFSIKEQQGEKPAEKKKISVDEFINEFPSSMQEYFDNDKLIIRKVRENLQNFILEVEKLRPILEAKDLSDRKEYEKLKIVVLENKGLYISQLNRLLEELNKKNSDNSRDLILFILSAIDEFFKKSNSSYEKATILIGKEIADIRALVGNFAQSLKLIFESNADFYRDIEKAKKISYIIEEISENNSINEEFENDIKKCLQELETSNDSLRDIEKKIEDLKKSPEYLADMEKKRLFEERKSNINKEIQKIRDKINFKMLANKFHSDEKNIEKIKQYSTNFSEALKSDKNLEFFNLLGYFQSFDSEKIKEIQQFLENSPSIKTETDIKHESYQNELKETSNKINALNDLILEIRRKKEKQLAKKEITMAELKSIALSIKPGIEF